MPTEQVTTLDTTTAAVAAPADISEQVSAAVAAENGRIMGILNCEEAKGVNHRRAYWPKHRA
jgi:hypothetical protein